MLKTSGHTTIWKRNGVEHDDLQINIPQTITNDISFQLMFGVTPHSAEDEAKVKRHHENYKKDQTIYNITQIKELYK